ncbi:DEAD/DEAH box helicase [Alphaproteobacteria bacterium]|nr:DEAD/DEAH box helicase [Alphaproteobacteria bacterium]MDC0394471.1 DEAD/DEAH box helicase [Alphaproteobacteria bacterium]
MSSTFSELGLSAELCNAVSDLGYEAATPIQAKAIPIILMGRDVMGSAQTGTGKTASFTLPMIDILDSGIAKARMPRSLILAPTRELAAQVAESFEKFSANHNLSMALLIGGVSFSDQESALEKGVDVLIATPGRLLDHFERGKVLLQDVKILVIDEADRMLDMGFIPDVERIVSLLPKIRQTLFFSATLSDEIHKIGDKFVMNPKIIEVARVSQTASTITQFICKTTPKLKQSQLRDLLNSEPINNAVIFCNRKKDIASLVRALKTHNFNVAALHGDMTQSARLAALKAFKDGETRYLIASDVAARGLDIPSVSHVFNYDVPSSAEDYVHRIGRTGRAGRSGRAFTLVSGSDDEKYLAAIEQLISVSIPELSKENPKPTAKSKKNSSEKAPLQKEVSEKSLNNVEKPKTKPSENTEKAALQKETEKPVKTNRYNEKRPPEWTGGKNFKDPDSLPAFLK